MSRSDSRDDRDQANETPLGRMVLSQGRSGGATSAKPRSLSIPSPEREQPTALSRSRDLVFGGRRIRSRISAKISHC
jgi:hypothetical protein